METTQATQPPNEVPPQPQQEVENKPEKEKKPKKPRTEAQMAATKKALAALTASRKDRAEKQNAKKEEIKQAKKIIEDKVIKEDLSFVLKSDFESMRKELAELKALHSLSQQKATETKAAPKERIVERVIERVPTPIVQPAKLTGNALLDRVFGFDK